VCKTEEPWEPWESGRGVRCCVGTKEHDDRRAERRVDSPMPCGQAQAHGKRKLHPSCMACHGIGAKTRKPTASRAGAVPGKGRAPPATTACRRTTAKIGKRPKRLKQKGTTYPYAGTPSWWLKTSKQTTDSITMVHVCVDKSRRACVQSCITHWRLSKPNTVCGSYVHMKSIQIFIERGQLCVLWF
jgi:hypothetical protein